MSAQKINPSDICLAKNQIIGDGGGYAALRDLYETKSGERNSIRKTNWERCTETSDRPIKWRFNLSDNKAEDNA